MQQSSLRLAAVVALALLSSTAALAFDIQSGGSGPGATAQPYADPQMRFDPDGTPRYDVDTDAATRFDADGKEAPNHNHRPRQGRDAPVRRERQRHRRRRLHRARLAKSPGRTDDAVGLRATSRPRPRSHSSRH